MKEIHSEVPPSSATRSLGHRFWIPITTALLTLAGIGFVQLQPEMERNYKGWLTASITLLALIAGLVWFFLLSRYKGRVRWITFGLLIVGVTAFTRMVRLDGTVDGTGLPKLAWRWAPIQKANLDPAPVATANRPSPTASVLNSLVDVPQFYGPNRDGIVTGAKLDPDWIATPPRQLWRQPIGAGWSSFAVVAGRAYTQEQRGEEESVTCYDLLTGKLLWAHGNAVHYKQWQGGNGPRATPTVMGGRVFAIGATGILDCLEASTGKPIWSRDVLGELKLENLIWGISGSPLVFEETVVVTGGLTAGPTIIAYRRSDGQLMWKSGSDKASYASPILAKLAGTPVILSFNAASLTAHDPATGAVLLSYPWTDDKWPKASQPVVIGDNRVFISAGYGAGCELLEVTKGTDGQLSARQVWKNLKMKTQFNSVAARNGYLYGLDDGLLACVEIATGTRKWKDGRYGSGQTLLSDDLVIVQSEPGAVLLAEANPDRFKELGRIPALSSKTWNHPTLAGRYLLVRNSEESACYELPVQTRTPSTSKP